MLNNALGVSLLAVSWVCSKVGWLEGMVKVCKSHSGDVRWSHPKTVIYYRECPCFFRMCFGCNIISFEWSNVRDGRCRVQGTWIITDLSIPLRLSGYWRLMAWRNRRLDWYLPWCYTFSPASWIEPWLVLWRLWNGSCYIHEIMLDHQTKRISDISGCFPDVVMLCWSSISFFHLFHNKYMLSPAELGYTLLLVFRSCQLSKVKVPLAAVETPRKFMRAH